MAVTTASTSPPEAAWQAQWPCERAAVSPILRLLDRDKIVNLECMSTHWLAKTAVRAKKAVVNCILMEVGDAVCNRKTKVVVEM